MTGTESFDIDSLLAAARSETGLDDFGSADFEEGLRVLATSCWPDQVRPSPLGRALAEVRG